MSKHAFFASMAVSAACMLPVSGAAEEARDPKAFLLDYTITISAPMETLVATTDKAIGGALESFKGQTFATKNGTLLLVLSPYEQAYFKNGELERYQYVVTADAPPRATPSMTVALPVGMNQVARLRYFDKDMFGHLTEKFRLELVDGRPFRVAYDPGRQTYSFYLE